MPSALRSPSGPSCFVRSRFTGIGLVATTALAATLLAGCGAGPDTRRTGPARVRRRQRDRVRLRPRRDSVAFPQPGAGKPGEWTLPGRDYAGTRYSPLTQITTANAKDLAVAWTFSTGVLHGHEGQPLVVGSTMYLVTPWPNIVYALDLAHPDRPGQMDLSAQSGSRLAGRGLLRHREPRRLVRRREDRLQHARQSHHRPRREHRARRLDDEDGRHQSRRDDDHGAAHHRRQGASPASAAAEMGVRGLARRARPRDRQGGLEGLQHRLRTRTYASGRRFKPFYPGDRAKDLGAHHLDAAISGRSAAGPRGAG